MAAARRGRAPRPARCARRCAPATPPLAERRAAVQQPAPHPGHHPRVAVHPADLRVGPAGPAPRAHGDRRRDPRAGRRQARRPPGAVAGTARPPGARGPAAADRPVGHRAADGGGQPAAGRRPPGPCPASTPAAARDLDLRDRGARGRAGRGLHQRAVGRDLRPGGRRWPAQHRSTIVFVNTRRLVERVALHLGERLGTEAVAAHHGSLSRARRFAAEQRLKSGQLKAIVATASLELGIDVGAVDLVCLIGSPRSIATGVQRVGRSGHAVGGTPKGRFFPLTRDQLVRMRGAGAGRPPGRAGPRSPCGTRPLDILAQQIVAACAAEEWDEDALLRAGAAGGALRRAWPASASTPWSTCCPRGSPPAAGAPGPCCTGTRVNRRLRGRRGARLAAITSGGAIPDTGLLRRRARARGDGGRHRRRGLRHREHGRRRVPAGQHLLAHPAGGERPGAGRGRRRRGAHHPVLAGRGPGPHPRAVGRGGPLREEIAAARQAARIPSGCCAWLRGGLRARRRRRHAGARLRAGRAGRAGGGARRRPAWSPSASSTRAGGMQLVIHAPFGGPHQPRLGHGPAQALLPHLRLRAAGRRHRRRRPAVAGPAAQLPARQHLRSGAAPTTSTRC